MLFERGTEPALAERDRVTRIVARSAGRVIGAWGVRILSFGRHRKLG